jgi:hydrogenase maturation protease
MSDSRDGAWGVTPGTIKVIGIGQSLRSDDAAGLAAVRLWNETYQQKANRPWVQIELAELPGIALLDLLQGALGAILVDAVCSESAPGTIHVLNENQLEAFMAGSASAHGWGVAETLALGRKLRVHTLPEILVLVGIEAGHLDMGGELSEAVTLALPKAAQTIEQQVSTLLGVPSHPTSPRISPR